MSASDRLRLLPRDDAQGWTRYAWLLYLSVIFVQPALLHASAGAWGACIAVTVVFLTAYFRGHWLRGRDLWPIILVNVALGAAFAPTNPGGYVFFVYAASFAARLERVSEAVAWIGAAAAAGFLTAFASHAPLYLWIALGLVTPFVASVGFHQAQSARATESLRRAHDEIERLAAVAERERIARDLHDVLGHTLSLIVLKSELASKLAEREPGRAVREIRDVEAVSRAALHDVREAIRGYRPSLAGELVRARGLLETARIAATVDVSFEARDLDAYVGVEDALAFALREAVTNVVRHSNASRATIRGWRDSPSERLVLEVTDDGRGTSGPEGAGLRGMRERVAAVAGRITSMAAGGRGTRLTVAIPIAPAPPARESVSA
jgi:two-component system, NarL family, sensor histidine kinase DesK